MKADLIQKQTEPAHRNPSAEGSPTPTGTARLLNRSPQAQALSKTAALLNGRAIVQAKPNTTGLPDNLKSGVESLSGVSLEGVKVHYNSDKPTQLNAHAYAQGTDIHVAPGQEKHLPHEAWHVVQQAQGRVRPTIQMKKGVPVNDDTFLEREADTMGAKALQFNSGATESSDAEGTHETVHPRVLTSQLKVIQLMTVGEYDTWASANEGMTVPTILDEGYTALLAFEGESKGESAELAEARKVRWQADRRAEITAALALVTNEKFLADSKLRVSVQMMIQGVARGSSMLAPPSVDDAIRENQTLFRGSTIDTRTGEPYVGSEGSRAGSPTTPSPTIAALFATKSATENQASGIVIYGPTSNVRGHGFAPPDVMSGQEQEITVAASPAVTNASLGNRLPLADFRKALSLVGEDIPATLTAGTDFDNRILRAARTGLTPAMKTRLDEILANPSVNLPAWQAVIAAADSTTAEDSVSQKLQSMQMQLDRKKGKYELGDSVSKLDTLKGLHRDLKTIGTLAEYRTRLGVIQERMTALQEQIRGLVEIPKPPSEPEPEDDDFSLFD